MLMFQIMLCTSSFQDWAKTTHTEAPLEENMDWRCILGLAVEPHWASVSSTWKWEWQYRPPDYWEDSASHFELFM